MNERIRVYISRKLLEGWEVSEVFTSDSRMVLMPKDKYEKIKQVLKEYDEASSYLTNYNERLNEGARQETALGALAAYGLLEEEWQKAREKYLEAERYEKNWLNWASNLQFQNQQLGSLHQQHLQAHQAMLAAQHQAQMAQFQNQLLHQIRPQNQCQQCMNPTFKGIHTCGL